MIRALLILLTLVTAACSRSEPVDVSSNEESVPEPIRNAALGDSTTEAGWDGTAKLVYPERLVGELEVRGIEANVVSLACAIC